MSYTTSRASSINVLLAYHSQFSRSSGRFLLVDRLSTLRTQPVCTLLPGRKSSSTPTFKRTYSIARHRRTVSFHGRADELGKGLTISKLRNSAPSYASHPAITIFSDDLCRCTRSARRCGRGRPCTRADSGHRRVFPNGHHKLVGALAVERSAEKW